MDGYRVHAAKAQASHTVATGRTGPVALDASHLRRLVIQPALSEIALWSPAAEELVLGTAIAERRLSFLKQLGSGPALGLWQIEPDTHRDVYDNFLEYREGLYDQVLSLSAPGQTFEENLTSNMQYGAAICRLCYYRAPEARPDEGDLQGQAGILETLLQHATRRRNQGEVHCRSRRNAPQ